MLRARTFAVAALAATGFGSVALAGANPPPPPEDPVVELGRRLFFDPAASRLGMRSCADCHDPSHGWSDPAARSDDDRGLTRRHSQTLIDCSASPRFHWDGEFATAEDLVSSRIAQPPTASYFDVDDDSRETSPLPPDPDGLSPDFEPNPPEDCRGPRSTIARRVFVDAPGFMPEPAERLTRGDRYREALGKGSSGRLSTARMAHAIAAFCRTIRSGTSAYDRFAAGDPRAISPSAARGLALFQGPAGCTSCHTMEGAKPTFTDGKFHCTGISRRRQRIDASRACGSRALDEGAGRVEKNLLGTTASFKTPTLRDVARRGPFMHDGGLAALEDVVAFYGSRPEEGLLDPRMPKATLDAQDARDIAEFLRTLDSDERPGKARVLWSRRAKRTRVRLLDADGLALSDRAVVLVPSGDVLPGVSPPAELSLRTDLQGWFEYVPPATTHVRLVVEGGLRPQGGTWIPDTCDETRITLPIRGVTRVRVTFSKEQTPPPLLVFQHLRAQFFPDHRLPITTLVLETRLATPLRGETVTYRGEARTDVPPAGRLRLPSFGSRPASYREISLGALPVDVDVER